MSITVAFKGKTFITGVRPATDFWTKLSGYMFRSSPHVPGLLFEPCNSIQTTFMRFDLDLVFLTKDNKVVKILRNVKPWRFTLFYFRARRTLEVPAGVIPAELREGDVLEVSHV